MDKHVPKIRFANKTTQPDHIVLVILENANLAIMILIAKPLDKINVFSTSVTSLSPVLVVATTVTAVTPATVPLLVAWPLTSALVVVCLAVEEPPIAMLTVEYALNANQIAIAKTKIHRNQLAYLMVPALSATTTTTALTPMELLVVPTVTVAIHTLARNVFLTQTAETLQIAMHFVPVSNVLVEVPPALMARFAGISMELASNVTMTATALLSHQNPFARLMLPMQTKVFTFAFLALLIINAETRPTAIALAILPPTDVLVVVSPALVLVMPTLEYVQNAKPTAIVPSSNPLVMSMVEESA